MRPKKSGRIGKTRTTQTKSEFDMNLARASFPVKAADADKIKYGRTLVIAGSRNVYGACFFAAKSALMSGAGMIKIVTHINNRLPLTRDLPEAMFSFYKCFVSRKAVCKSLNWADSVVIGPGLSAGLMAKRLMATAIEYIKDGSVLIIDADAINILSADGALFERLVSAVKDKGLSAVITPHKGELGRLKKALKIVDLDDDEAAAYIYNIYGIAVVRKGGPTVSFADKAYVNTTGNEGMATAGSGDVLSGILGGMLHRVGNKDLSEGIALSVFIHGLCGDLAASKRNSMAVTATDIMNEIPAALDCVEKA